MELSNREQNGVIFSIAEIIGKMSNQVNFLIRNHKLLSQLDVDMLMENTRRLYDTICSVQCNMDVDSIPMEVEGMRNEELGIRSEELRIGSDTDEEEFIDDEMEFDDEDDEIEDEIEIDEEEIKFDDEESEEEEEFEDDEDDETIDDGFKDEVRIDFEIDDDDAIISDPVADSGIRSYIKTSVQADDDSHITIGDKLEASEDNSLASVLQKKAITDLVSAIDLNDRFLFLNELFNSNMEKYNKAIRMLNCFSTLIGAKTYMSELQIELQWDCESDAYKKLNNLIERRFI